MTLPHRRDRTLVLLLLLTGCGVAITLGPLAALAGGVLLMVLAIIKARLVVLDYYGFRGAQGPWRSILLVWVVAVAAASLVPTTVGFFR